jgi:hypothetical protein
MLLSQGKVAGQASAPINGALGVARANTAGGVSLEAFLLLLQVPSPAQPDGFQQRQLVSSADRLMEIITMSCRLLQRLHPRHAHARPAQPSMQTTDLFESATNRFGRLRSFVCVCERGGGWGAPLHKEGKAHDSAWPTQSWLATHAKYLASSKHARHVASKAMVMAGTELHRGNW